MISGKMFFRSSFFLKFISLILLQATAESEVSFFTGFKWRNEEFFLTPAQSVTNLRLLRDLLEATRPRRPPFSSISLSERPEKKVKIRQFILVTLTQQCSTKLRSFEGFKSSCLFKKVGKANANCLRNLNSSRKFVGKPRL